MGMPPKVIAVQQGATADQQQLGSIDLGYHLAAYFMDGIEFGRRCFWPLNADPFVRR
jgi:hypothetical protein